MNEVFLRTLKKGLPRPSRVNCSLHPPCPPNSSASIRNDHFPRDYSELLGPSGVATLERLLTESLEYSQPTRSVVATWMSDLHV